MSNEAQVTATKCHSIVYCKQNCCLCKSMQQTKMFRFKKIWSKRANKDYIKIFIKIFIELFFEKCIKICVQTLFSSIEATTIVFVFCAHGVVVVIGMTRTYKFAACTVIVYQIEFQRRWSHFGINIFVESSSLFSISISTDVKMAGESKISRTTRKKGNGKSTPKEKSIESSRPRRKLKSNLDKEVYEVQSDGESVENSIDSDSTKSNEAHDQNTHRAQNSSFKRKSTGIFLKMNEK